MQTIDKTIVKPGGVVRKYELEMYKPCLSRSFSAEWLGMIIGYQRRS